VKGFSGGSIARSPECKRLDVMRVVKNKRCGLLPLVAAVAVAFAAGAGRVSFASGQGGHGASHGSHGESHSQKAPQPEKKEDATKSGSNGMQLGEFRIRAYYPAESQKSTASFSLYATVEKEKLSDSQHLLENRLHKLRDQVIVVTRMFPLEDFNDPEELSAADPAATPPHPAGAGD
jgi:hypothetical protein